ncbi:MAG: transcriptional repressor [Guyparkeria sp.]|uniref:transcriptional repressor n=1 Tax=Guyparkeria sp. TaxID=2035736 RepID=UPI0039797900
MSCASHDHDQCIEAALARAEAICREAGARLTPIRREVLKEVWANHEATKAYDLIERLSRHGEQVKPPTVYRALDFLLAQGLIHRIESLNAFIGCAHPQDPHQAILLICSHCGDIEEQSSETVHTTLGELAARSGFAVRSEVVELRGLCRRCRLEN